MTKFKMAVTCPVCGEMIVSNGVVTDFTVSSNIPIVDLRHFSDMECICNECGTVVHVNDDDNLYEFIEPEV